MAAVDCCHNFDLNNQDIEDSIPAMQVEGEDGQEDNTLSLDMESEHRPELDSVQEPFVMST